MIINCFALVLSTLSCITWYRLPAAFGAGIVPRPNTLPVGYELFKEYSFNKSVHHYSLPSFGSPIYAVICGATGGSFREDAGGRGGCIHTILPPKDYFIYVGGAGKTGAVGGFNGGGNANDAGPGSGGGASDIRTSLSSTTRVAVGGGGGGAGPRILYSFVFYSTINESKYMVISLFLFLLIVRSVL